MTEEEAKTKWCPMSRHVIDIEPSYPMGNRFGQFRDGYDVQCLASECAMWQHSYTDETGVHGYCGLIKT